MFQNGGPGRSKDQQLEPRAPKDQRAHKKTEKAVAGRPFFKKTSPARPPKGTPKAPQGDPKIDKKSEK